MSGNRHMSRTVKIIGAAVIVAAAVGGFLAWRESQPTASSFRAHKVTRGDLEITILSTGAVQPKNRLEIKPPLAGRAEEVLVNEGDRVRKGQLLLWMSSTERAALLDAARARGPDELRRWEEFYRATPVLAPIDGTVILRNVEPGQSFTNNDAVLVIADRLMVEALVDETDIAQVRIGQTAYITLDAYASDRIPAKVDAIAYEAKTVNNVTTYTVDVVPNQTPPFMRSGMTSNVSFLVAHRRGVLVLPTQAVRTRDGRHYVLVPSDARGAEPIQKTVATGITDGKQFEIVAGLDEGDIVLLPEIRTGNSRNGGVNPFSFFGRPRSTSSRSPNARTR